MLIISSTMDDVRSITFKIIFSCVVASLCVCDVSANLADYVTICKAKDPALDKCLITAGHTLFKRMQEGIPEFNIKPVDPMAVPHLHIHRSDIGMSLTLSNSTHEGLSTATITKAHAMPEKQYLEFQLEIPEYKINGHYDINGKMMLLPIKGQGDSKITLVNTTVTWKIQGELEKRDGADYMKVKSFAGSIEPKLMKLQFDNLFNGNKLLGDTMNELLNSHWQDIFRKIRPPLEENYSKLLKKFAEKIFSKTPYNQIFAE